MKSSMKLLVPMACALCLAMIPLTGCTGLLAAGKEALLAALPQLIGTEMPQPEPVAETNTTEASADIDLASWNTLGDALAFSTDSISYGSDGERFVCMFSAGERVFRVIATMDPAVDEAMGKLDFLADDYDQQLAEVIGGLVVESAQELTDNVLSLNELTAFVGKTGQDLVDEGFVFDRYVSYDGSDTYATMSFGFISYTFTFDVSISEAVVEEDEEGAAIMDAVVTEVSDIYNFSENALNPAFE